MKNMGLGAKDEHSEAHKPVVIVEILAYIRVL
jgi:hypothetical protein